jgi:hypothetical protein
MRHECPPIDGNKYFGDESKLMGGKGKIGTNNKLTLEGQTSSTSPTPRRAVAVSFHFLLSVGHGLLPQLSNQHGNPKLLKTIADNNH